MPFALHFEQNSNVTFVWSVRSKLQLARACRAVYRVQSRWHSVIRMAKTPWCGARLILSAFLRAYSLQFTETYVLISLLCLRRRRVGRR
jgi:hypothetical protein